MEVKLSQLLFIITVFSASHCRQQRYRDNLSYSPSADTKPVYPNEYNPNFRRDASNLLPSQKPTNECYSSDGKAMKCSVSEFGNVAVNKVVTASSTCGTPPSRICSTVLSHTGTKMDQCQPCDANHKSRMHPASYMVDSSKSSCWVSEPFANPTEVTNVTITISLGKKYELTYIILPFCNKMPESMALYKSADFGNTWIPLQYYSSQCRKIFKLATNGIITKANEQEAVCKDIYSSTNPLTNTRVAFSLVDGRPSSFNLESSPVLRDWVTVTDVKVVFHRLNAPLEKSEKDYNYYSLSDLTLGGRCKCNGHASQCIEALDGSTVCDCQHNTAGADCDRCKPFYFDRPWKPATNEDANECKACECNLHSNNCYFSAARYQLSGSTGGVCMNCRHNTDGAHCHYCKEGFYRDYTKALSDPKVCKECGCHEHGSLGTSCTPDGQCVCKDGVAGLKCDRCKPGYIMTKYKATPCEKGHFGMAEFSNATGEMIPFDLKEQPLQRNPDPSPTQGLPCGSCKIERSRIDMRKICRSAFAVQAVVRSRETVSGGWVRFNLEVKDIYKEKDPMAKMRVRRGQQYAYVKESDLHCECPKLRINKSYLMIGLNIGEQDGLLLDRDSIVVRHRDKYEERVKQFIKKGKNSSCNALL